MTDLDLDAIKALTPDQRAAIDASVAGGLVAYLHRILDGHLPAFSRGRDNQLVFCGCRCDNLLCDRWAFAIHRNDVLTAYEAKVEDFAAETRRADTLVAEVERLRALVLDAVSTESGCPECDGYGPTPSDHDETCWIGAAFMSEARAALHPQEPSE